MHLVLRSRAIWDRDSAIQSKMRILENRVHRNQDCTRSDRHKGKVRVSLHVAYLGHQPSFCRMPRQICAQPMPLADFAIMSKCQAKTDSRLSPLVEGGVTKGNMDWQPFD